MVHLFRAGEFKPTNQGNETRPGADSKVSLKQCTEMLLFVGMNLSWRHFIGLCF